MGVCNLGNNAPDLWRRNYLPREFGAHASAIERPRNRSVPMSGSFAGFLSELNMGRSKFIAAAVAIGRDSGYQCGVRGRYARPCLYQVGHRWRAIYDWTGIYVGVEGGGSWGSSRHVDPATGLDDTNNYNVNGGFGGMTVGDNWQLDLGVRPRRRHLLGRPERQFDRQRPCRQPGFSSFTKEEWLATIRGRVGFAANNALSTSPAVRPARASSPACTPPRRRGVRHRGPYPQRLDRRRRRRMGVPAGMVGQGRNIST